MIRPPAGWDFSEIASPVRLARRRLAEAASVLLVTRTLDTVASGLQNGLWCFQSCETNKRHHLRYEKGDAPLSGTLLNSSGV